MDGRGALVSGVGLVHLELSRGEFLAGQSCDRVGVALEVFIEPVEGGDAEFLRVGMAAGRDGQSEVLRLAVQFVNARDLGVQSGDAVDRENAVAVGVQNEQRPWRDECGDLRKVPAVGVNLEHAIAMPLDNAIDHMVLQVGDAGDRRGGLDTLVECGDPPTVRAAAAAAGDTDAVFVDKVQRLEEVDRADAVPCLDTGGGVAARIPPPHAMPVGAVVDALKFAKLDRVDREANVAVAGEPRAVMLVVSLVAVIDAVDLHPAVAADVEDRRGGGGEFLRHVKIAGDVQAGAGLVVELAHLEFVVLHRAGDLDLQRRTLRQRVEPEHLAELAAVFVFLFVPVAERPDLGEVGLGQALGFVFEIPGKHPVSRRFHLSRLAKREQGGQRHCKNE